MVNSYPISLSINWFKKTISLVIIVQIIFEWKCTIQFKRKKKCPWYANKCQCIVHVNFSHSQYYYWLTNLCWSFLIQKYETLLYTYVIKKKRKFIGITKNTYTLISDEIHVFFHSKIHPNISWYELVPQLKFFINFNLKRILVEKRTAQQKKNYLKSVKFKYK